VAQEVIDLLAVLNALRTARPSSAIADFDVGSSSEGPPPGLKGVAGQEPVGTQSPSSGTF
jgi:hypothetical protein